MPGIESRCQLELSMPLSFNNPSILQACTKSITVLQTWGSAKGLG